MDVFNILKPASLNDPPLRLLVPVYVRNERPVDLSVNGQTSPCLHFLDALGILRDGRAKQLLHPRIYLGQGSNIAGTLIRQDWFLPMGGIL